MNTSSGIDISIIIPAYNEESTLENLFESIRITLINVVYEVIVVNNGSTDSSFEIASRQSDVTVLNIERNTPAYARNYGVKHSNGKLLVFLDGDVVVTKEWALELKTQLERELTSDSNLLTGNKVSIPLQPTWIEKNWFKPISLSSSKYINGANIVVSRKTFDYIGGFIGSLETGEDYEFSMRALSKGVLVINNPKYHVIHEGFPKTVKQFIRREIWHGKGDVVSLKSILASKVALMAIVFSIFNIAFLSSVIWWQLDYILIFGVAILCLITMMSAFKFLKYGFRQFIVNLPLSYLYLLGRSMSGIIKLK